MSTDPKASAVDIVDGIYSRAVGVVVQRNQGADLTGEQFAKSVHSVFESAFVVFIEQLQAEFPGKVDQFLEAVETRIATES